MSVDKRINCVKCGFIPSYNEKWKIEYSEGCFGYNKTCEWNDDNVQEHLHQECPVCGYTFAVKCNDYEEKAEKTCSTRHEVPVKEGIASPTKTNALEFLKKPSHGKVGVFNKETEQFLHQKKTVSSDTSLPVFPTNVNNTVTPSKCRNCPVEK